MLTVNCISNIRMNLIKKITFNKAFVSLYSFRLNLVKMSSCANPVEQQMRSKLTRDLQPEHLEIINESYMHNVLKGSETHFKVLVVSDKFSGLPLIKRHRMVNSILEQELNTGVHALSIVAKTKDQWQEGDKVAPSPNCRGGFGL